MKAKSKITLTPEQETLLITLYTKAQPGNPVFFDPKAQDILNEVDYDFTRLHVPYKTVILVCQRAKKLDAVVRDFLGEHPNGVVLHPGCGLDGRFCRVDNGQVDWYDFLCASVVWAGMASNRYTEITPWLESLPDRTMNTNAMVSQIS